MTDQPTDEPTEHERRVAEEERARDGSPMAPPEGSTDDVTGDAQAPTYGEEVDAEREGRRADQSEPGADDSDAPLDSAYKPRSG